MLNLQKAHKINNTSETALHNVYKVYLNSTAHKIERFLKGVWGTSPPRHLDVAPFHP